MNTISIKPKKEEDGDKAKSMSTKAPLTERIMKKAAAAVLTVGIALSPTSCNLICPFDTSALDRADGDVSDSDVDAGSDTDIVDSDIRDSDTVDSDVADADNEIVDADVADSDTLDGDLADADTIADSDVADGDMEDSDVADSDVADADPGPLCSGVFDEVFTEETFDKGTGREVGGYMITYVSQTTDGITMNIDCGSDSEEIASGDAITTMVEHTVEVPG